MKRSAFRNEARQVLMPFGAVRWEPRLARPSVPNGTTTRWAGNRRWEIGRPPTRHPNSREFGRCLLLFVAGLVILNSGARCYAETVYATWDNPVDGVRAIRPNNDLAIRFLSPKYTPFRLDSVTLGIENAGESFLDDQTAPGSFSLRLYQGNERPDVFVTTLVGDSHPIEYARYEYEDPSHTRLEPDTSYWLILHTDSNWYWWLRRKEVPVYPPLDSFHVHWVSWVWNGWKWQSANEAGTWTGAFELNATRVPEPSTVASAAAILAVLSLCFARNRERSVEGSA